MSMNIVLSTRCGAGSHAYRIKEVDFDGNFIYSKVNVVNILGSGLIMRVLGNPVVTGSATLEIVAAGNIGKASIDLFSLSGVKNSTRLQSLNSGSNIVNIPVDGLAAGTYVIKVMVNGNVYTTRFTKVN